MIRVVLLGPPGAGKGTQAARLAERWGVPAISTGDIFRANVSGGTALGEEAKGYMDAGALVPDEVTNAMVRDRLGHDDAAGGFLLDGFPRNPEQAVDLDVMLAGLKVTLDAAIEITADEDAVTERLLKRAEIEGRADDREDVIRERLRVYAEKTAPVTAFYDGKGLLVRVDGMGEVDDVTERILVAVAGR
jgi:adenylate kinase